MNKYNDFSFEKLSDEISVCVSKEHRFGTDAILLADFSKARRKDIVADYCSGCGIVSFLLKRNFSPKKIYALEIQQKAYDQILYAKEKFPLDEIIPFHTDLKTWDCDDELDLITCNPPYKTDGTGLKNDDDAKTIARHETFCTIDDICISARKNLKFGGRLCICQRPERLCDIMVSMRENSLEPKRIRFVSKTKDSQPWLVLVEGKKGSKPFLTVEPPLFMYDENGEYSSDLKSIYMITGSDKND